VIVTESQRDARPHVEAVPEDAPVMTTLASRALPTPDAITAAGLACETLADGVLALHGCGSLFVVDLTRSRFQRLPRSSDPRHALRYGSWVPLAELVLESDGTFTVQPGEGGGPRVRSHTHGDGCPCERRTHG
jgi:hypothetical protein